MADVSQIKLPNGTTYTLKDDGALQLTGGNVTGPVSFGDSVSIDSATIGNLVVNGGASFVNSKAIANQLIDSLDTASADWTDNTLVLTSDSTGDTNLYYRRAAVKAWNYINSKISAAGYTKNTGTITSVKTTAGAHTTINTTSGAVSFNVPTTAAHVGIKFGYTTSGNNRAVLQDSNGNLYVTQKDDNSGGTVTKVTAGTGLSIGTTAGGNFTTTGTINHTNSVTAQTTQAVYPIKIDAQGHISAYGSAQTILTIGTGASNAAAGNHTHSYLPLSGGTLTGRLTTADPINQLITGSGTAASSSNGNYFPAKWTFNTGQNASNGDIVTIKIPVAGHDYGVFMSVNNGTNYYPIVIGNGNGRLTTHFPNATPLMLVFDSSGSAASVFPLAGGTARVTVSDGVWRVVNYYNSTYYYESCYVTTGAAEAAKVGTLSNYALQKGYLQVAIYNANTYAGAITLNINGTGAKSIYINGSASSTSNHTLPKGMYLVYYDGTNYHFRTDGYTTANHYNEAPASEVTRYPLTTGVTGVGLSDIINTNTRYWIKKGTTSAVGYNYLALGNATASGTDYNSQGYIRLYGQNTGYSNLTYANSTSNVTNTLPATSGTLLNTAGGQQINNITTLYREGTTANNYPAGLKFKVKDTTTGQTYDSGYLYAYQDHGSTTNGVNFVLNGGGGLFIGSGEAPGAHYAAKGASYTEEDTFITADGTVYIQAKGNTIANRLGFYIDTSQQVIPCKADAATNNVGSLGTSSYKWGNLYVTNINGVAVGNSPKFTDSGGTVTSITLTQGTGISIGSSGTAITTSGTRTISLATSGATAGTYGAESTGNAILGGHSGFDVVGITVDKYGRITNVLEKTISIYAGDILCANAASSTSTTIPKSTITQIPLTQTLVSRDYHSNLSLASNRIAIATAGTYRITGSIYMSTTAPSTVGVYIMKGSGAFSSATEITSSYIYIGIAGTTSINVTKIIEATAGTYIYLAARASNGGTVASGNTTTYLEVEELRF